ncbi:hypothetical protein ABH37_09995 [Mycobacterium haemophilum]|uniref:Uncharacterized protein n=1 Tax=Mycobacterium haemophilum TaxID=29311 RepID=A0A0I9ZQ45_9MYCO|nr:hypothetical protein ABH39_07455 [Mycobacterium haemophilum]KLO36574.1 hypothetical protein ABH38_11370 [Mycobacterium haemophilum]KLO42500.1 hypothetical protein ABH37_09995 [Mycobacterium haemophilum]KLO55377.1 hypothetical protein ABH36_06975 [Mycobacterium haemophilum]
MTCVFAAKMGKDYALNLVARGVRSGRAGCCRGHNRVMISERKPLLINAVHIARLPKVSTIGAFTDLCESDLDKRAVGLRTNLSQLGLEDLILFPTDLEKICLILETRIRPPSKETLIRR